MKTGKFNALVDSAWGSSGKGAAAARIVSIFKTENVSSTNLPNAGHTCVINGEIFVGKVLPTPAFIKKHGLGHSNLKAWIGPTSAYEVDQLNKEVGQLGLKYGEDLFIHDRSAIVSDSHRIAEGRGGMLSTEHVSSTMSGSGAVSAFKIMRLPDVKLARDLDIPTLTPPEFYAAIRNELYEGRTFLHEVSQGWALSINSGTHYPQCLSGDSRVYTESGPVKLRDLVNSKAQAKVWSVSSDGTFELKPIVGWYKNPLGDRKWLQIITPTTAYNKDKAYIGPAFTNDHEVLTNYGYVRVDQLKPGYHEIATMDRQFDDVGMQVFLGSLLGDGTVPNQAKSKARACLEITHGAKQRNYNEYKSFLLSKTLGGGIREVVTSKGSFKPDQVLTRYHSSYSYYLRRLAQGFNALGNKSEMDVGAVLDQCGPLAMAIWFMDDGQYKTSSKNGPEVFLHTHRYPRYSQEVIVSKLADKFGIKSSIHTTKTPSGKSFDFIRISRLSHDSWFKLIARHVHHDLRYKIPDGKYESFVPSESIGGGFATEPIISVQDRVETKRPGFKCSFCIEVEKNHNFLVSHDKGFFVVKNCTSRECTPQQAYADMGIVPGLVGDVYLNVRSFPIRVGNNYDETGKQVGYSGDGLHDHEETSWAQIGVDAEMPQDQIDSLSIKEKTTVTRKLRRVFTPSWSLLKQSAEFCGATKLILNFPQYIHWSAHQVRGGKSEFLSLHYKVREYVDKMQEVTGLPVVMIGTGASHEDFIWLD